MDFGVSTACFYPALTEKAVRYLAEHGVSRIELFVNTFREITPEYAERLSNIMLEYDMKAVSLHPFTSTLESLMFFSEYQYRYEDALEQHKRWYFDFMNRVGATIFVLHGCYNQIDISREMYCERYAGLRQAALEQGICVAQENVAPYKSHSVDFVKYMHQYLHGEVSFVLDVKQTVRAGQKLPDMIRAMSGAIAHVHISDHDENNDCLVIGEGSCDFARLFSDLDFSGFQGTAVLELYRKNYREYCQLYESCAKLAEIYAKQKNNIE